MSRRVRVPGLIRRVIAGTIATCLLVVAVVAAAIAYDRLGSEDEAGVEAAPLPTAEVEVRDLVVDYEVAGTLTHTGATTVTAPVSGTVLAVAEAGADVEAGEVLAVVEGEPVVLLSGSVPAWRDLVVGDEGADVAQLEAALSLLGFDPDGDVTVDEEFTAATATMVEDWQTAVGAEPTGTVASGSVVFAEGPLRVASVAAGVGSGVTNGETLVELISTTRVAEFAVTADEAATLTAGDAVEVELPDRSTVEATIWSVKPGSGSGSATVFAGFAPDAPLPSVDPVEIVVRWSRTEATDVVTVPASALLRLDRGVSVVTLVADDGTSSTVDVTVGRQVGSRVEVLSGVSPGDVVVAP